MIFYLVCFQGCCFDNASGLFRCHHATFRSGVRTVLVSYFLWWGNVYNKAIVSLKQAFLSSLYEYNSGNSNSSGFNPLKLT